MSDRVHIEPLKSGSYRARVTDPQTGRRISVTDTTETKVRARVEEARRIAHDVRIGVVDPKEMGRRFSRAVFGAPRVRDLWKVYESTLRGQWRQKANQYFRVAIEPTLGDRKAFELTPDVMAEWERVQRAAGRGKVSVGNVFIALRAAYRMAMHDRLGEIPWRKWRPEAAPRGEEVREMCRDVGELEALVRAALAHDARAIRSGAFGDLAVRILILALCGLRQGEAVALAWSDLSLEGDPPTMTVRHSAHPDWSKRGERPEEPPKWNRVRVQTLHENAASALRVQRARLVQKGWYRQDGPVFPAKGGTWRRANIAILTPIFRECVRAAALPNVEKWVVHSLRHTFATLETAGAFMLTGDVKAAMARTGHTRVETLVGYLHASNRGRPSSFIGTLSAGALPFALSAHNLGALSEEQTVQKATLAALAHDVGDLGAAPEKEQTLAELARLHPSDRPAVVMAKAEARYRTAYSKARREGLGPEACAQRGGASKRAFLGAWGKLQRQAQKRGTP